jgi:predicted component of type VI protein secretion system
MRVRACAGLAIAAALIAGCGDEDFENEPRAPVRVALTGVIQDDAVTVSPSKIGAGPVEITISNQTDSDRTITLEGESIVEEEGPVPPGDTATIQRTLEPGSYEVRAGSEKAVRQEIEPAMLEIGKRRANSNNELLLP